MVTRLHMKYLKLTLHLRLKRNKNQFLKRNFHQSLNELKVMLKLPNVVMMWLLLISLLPRLRLIIRLMSRHLNSLRWLSDLLSVGTEAAFPIQPNNTKQNSNDSTLSSVRLRKSTQRSVHSMLRINKINITNTYYFEGTIIQWYKKQWKLGLLIGNLRLVILLKCFTSN